MARTLRAFIEMNRQASRFFDRCFPLPNLDIFDLYQKTVGQHMNRTFGSVVVDVGGGKRCRFAKYRNSELRSKIVCVDVSMAEMQNNTDVDEKRVADVTRTLACADAEADLIVSSSVLEHLKEVSPFVSESARSLKDQGCFVHIFSCKFAPFALLNQTLPRRISGFFLTLVFPNKTLGYRAFYNRCYPSGLRKVLGASGFEVQSLVVSYSQSDYFDFFFPLYALSRFYEFIVQSLGLENLCAYVLVVARKSDRKGPKDTIVRNPYATDRPSRSRLNDALVRPDAPESKQNIQRLSAVRQLDSINAASAGQRIGFAQAW